MTKQVNKYYEGSLSFTQKATEQEVLQGKDLSGKHIENLCSGFLTNAIYANVVEGGKDFEQAKEKSLKMAAQVVVKHGKEIEEQLNKNDEAGLEVSQSGNQDLPNSSADVEKISGGTVAKVIEKISEIIAAMSPEERNSAAQNFSALFAVLGKSFDKIDQTMEALASEPVVVANIKDILEGTEGGKVFDKLIETHLDENQKAEVNKVSEEDLETYRKEKAQQQKNQSGVSLS